MVSGFQRAKLLLHGRKLETHPQSDCTDISHHEVYCWWFYNLLYFEDTPGL